MTEAPHIPVMLNDVLAALAPQDGEVYVDGTFGAGGYSSAFLDASDCTVLAIDRDRSALEAGAALTEKYGQRLVLNYGCFGDVLALVRAAGYERVDGFVIDIGVSSMQIDQAERGFSFRYDAPLDMRMDRDSGGRTAADIVNTLAEKDLADLIYRYGEERHSRRIARQIVVARAEAPIETTGRLADLVRAAVPKSKDQIDPATRTFQALRIAVNDELGELERALATSEHLLSEGGRLIVVSFHSLEDSIVKHFLRERSGQQGRGSRYLPDAPDDGDLPSFTLPSRKAVFPSEEESASNPRARSARMRVAVRTNAPPSKTPVTQKYAEGFG